MKKKAQRKKPSRPRKSSRSTRRTFQKRVNEWVVTCFGEEVAANRTDRVHRFTEESLELAQAGGCTAAEAHELVDYVFGRPVGDPQEEIGGVMVTLSALCTAFGLELTACSEAELKRVWALIERIRAKQAQKPKFSPLPGPSPTK